MAKHPDGPDEQLIVATCGGGLEPILKQEILGLPAGGTTDGVARSDASARSDAAGPRIEAVESGVVRFRGSAETVVAANRRLRTASRVLLPLSSGRAHSYDQVYALAGAIPWEERISPDATFAVTAIVRSKTLSNHKFLAMRVKDAVADRQRNRLGKRSSVDRKQPDYPIVVHAAEDFVEISLDASGRSLHERGYRREAGEAPLRESLAAGLVLRSDWDGSVPLFDPFCGSGTIAIEAALIQAGRFPGDLGRRYAFERWPEFRGVRPPTPPHPADADAETAAAGPSPAPILAADRDPEVLEKARRNARRAGVEDRITFVAGAFEELEPDEILPTSAGVIITNPPYGERMVYEAVAVMYQMIGDNLKARYPGWSAWIFTANMQAAKRIGLRSSSKTILYNGGLESRLYEFQMY